MVMKEALQNVSKHADAHSRERSSWLCVKDRLELSVADDGRGFPVDSTRRFGNGLTNMRQRVAELKGTFRTQLAARRRNGNSKWSSLWMRV